LRSQYSQFTNVESAKFHQTFNSDLLKGYHGRDDSSPIIESFSSTSEKESADVSRTRELAILPGSGEEGDQAGESFQGVAVGSHGHCCSRSWTMCFDC
jgi:hypothetical protein